MYYKKYCLLLGLAALVSPVYADILVILPESGTMARASQSIKSSFSKDRIKKLFIVRETGTESATELFFCLNRKKRSSKEGVLLLGSQHWLERIFTSHQKAFYRSRNRN
jgi:hypothetical protein